MIWWATGVEEKQMAAQWLQQRFPSIVFGNGASGQFAIVGVGNMIAAIVAFTQWNPVARTIQGTIAADTPRWARKQDIAEILAYPFMRCGAYKMWASVEKGNVRSERLLCGLGFQREAEIRDQFGPGSAAIVFGMIEPEWRQSVWSKMHG